MKKRILFIPIFICLIFCNCRQSSTSLNYDIQKKSISKKAMVVSAHPLASNVGATILRQGGNAIDAAVAVQFALAVVYPRAGNIGGGGFMILHDHQGKNYALDFREKAPKKATKNMYLDSLDNVIDGLSINGHLAAGVPGTVDGMVKAHEKFGTLDWKNLIQPSINLATEGFQITENEAETLNEKQDGFKKYNNTVCLFYKSTRWKKGDLLIQPDLAKTLTLIQQNGEAGFYEGQVADQIVAEMKSGNGIISHNDLTSYNAVWRTPIIGTYKNYEIISMPPPSSGGIALIQMLNKVENYPLKEMGFQSADAVHLMAEAERRVYSDRAKHLGDADFYDVPVAQLVDKKYAKDRMTNFNMEKATPSDDISASDFSIAESEETTHFSIIDEAGNAVSITTTLNANYGSKTVVKGAGFLLNNEMDDFSAKPGVPNLYGLVGAEANAIVPEKRMLSSMTPTIILKEDKPFLVLGTPGGSTIITSVFQVFLNIAEFGMNVEAAVNANRFHHQWLPDKISIEENTFSKEVEAALKAKGHLVESRDPIGAMEAIHVLPDGSFVGVGDRRKDDHAEGL